MPQFPKRSTLIKPKRSNYIGVHEISTPQIYYFKKTPTLAKESLYVNWKVPMQVLKKQKEYKNKILVDIDNSTFGID